MTAPRISDAMVHLQAAIEALTNEGVLIDAVTGAEAALAPLEACVGDDLIRIDRHICGGRPGLIGCIGQSVRDALIEIIAAQNALQGKMEGGFHVK